MGSEWILGRLAGGVWSRFHWLRIGAGGGLLQCGDEPAGSCATELQSAFQEKVPAGGWRLWCGSGGKFSGGWTTGLLLVGKSMTHLRVTLLHTG
jgi:hypothetical protein